MTRLKSLAFGLVLGAGSTMCLVEAADAQTINLQCKGNGPDILYVDLDTGAAIATSWVTGWNRSDAPSFHATITDAQVTWIAGTGTFTLDRNTAALNELRPDGSTLSWTCTKTSPVF